MNGVQVFQGIHRYSRVYKDVKGYKLVHKATTGLEGYYKEAIIWYPDMNYMPLLSALAVIFSTHRNF